MARIKPEEIVEALDSQFRHALRDAVKQVVPGAKVDEYAAAQGSGLAITHLSSVAA